MLATRFGQRSSADDAAYGQHRDQLAKAETPRALTWIAILVALLSTVNYLVSPHHFPYFHVIDYGVALVLLASGLWLRRPGTPAALASWVFSGGMVVLAMALLIQTWLAQLSSPNYVLLVIALTAPVALAWVPALGSMAIMCAGVGVVASALGAGNAVDWISLAFACALSGSVILWLRLGSIREETRANMALASQSRRLQLVLESSQLGVWDWDMATGQMLLDDRWAAILGYRLEELQPVDHTTDRLLTHPEDLAASDILIERHIRGLIPFYVNDLRMRHRDGHWIWVRDRGAIVERAPDGAGLRMTGTLEDINEQKIASIELRVLATHDTLTGLANRTALLEEIDRALSAGRRSGRSVALLMLDLDNFKYVNDTLGHAVGDEVLRAAADRISAAVRAGDLVSRQGGDEFLVVLRELEGADEALAAARRLLAAFHVPLATGATEQYATVSIGLTMASSDSQVDDLIREADTAMYVAKSEGRDRISVFSEDLRAALTERVTIERDLRSALVNEQFAVWYQPDVDLASGRTIAMEALVRWNHPDGSIWTADRFIDVAEESGLIRGLGDWVLLRACIDGANWAASGRDRRIMVRVNVSALQLAEPGLLAVLDRAIALSGIDPDLLCLEITETTLLRQTATARLNLDGIRERGVHLALDDFGTGYASLTYLRQYPIDHIKIDRSFVMHLPMQENDSRIVGGIIALARSLSVGVTAEGVETPDQAELLRAMGCPSAQGYLFSRAVPFEEATALLGRPFEVSTAQWTSSGAPTSRAKA